jgi:hypothetical protein
MCVLRDQLEVELAAFRFRFGADYGTKAVPQKEQEESTQRAIKDAKITTKVEIALLREAHSRDLLAISVSLEPILPNEPLLPCRVAFEVVRWDRPQQEAVTHSKGHPAECEIMIAILAARIWHAIVSSGRTAAPMIPEHHGNTRMPGTRTLAHHPHRPAEDDITVPVTAPNTQAPGTGARPASTRPRSPARSPRMPRSEPSIPLKG